METRREERIGQLLQELKRSDKLHLKDAAAAGTVGYELMCALALRVPVVTV